MKKAIEIIKSEIAQRKLGISHIHNLNKLETQKEIDSLNEVLKVLNWYQYPIQNIKLKPSRLEIAARAMEGILSGKYYNTIVNSPTERVEDGFPEPISICEQALCFSDELIRQESKTSQIK